MVLVDLCHNTVHPERRAHPLKPREAYSYDEFHAFAVQQFQEDLAEAGVAILFASSEMEEILGMSDRALVMHEGQITGELSRDELSEESVMQLATGNTPIAAGS